MDRNTLNQALKTGWLVALVGVGALGNAQNLLSNGDFEAGAVGFSSDYVLATNNTTEGQYTVSATPSSFNGAFFNGGDHTTGTGKMMVVNGATSGIPAVWRQLISVIGPVTYQFRGFISTAVGGGPAVLLLKVNGMQMGPSITAPNGVGSWREWHQTFTPLVNSTATLIDRELEPELVPERLLLGRPLRPGRARTGNDDGPRPRHRSPHTAMPKLAHLMCVSKNAALDWGIRPKTLLSGAGPSCPKSSPPHACAHF